MKTIKRGAAIAAALAVMQLASMGVPQKASAIFVKDIYPDLIDINGVLSASSLTFTNAVTINSSTTMSRTSTAFTTLQAPSLSIQNTLYGTGSISLLQEGGALGALTVVTGGGLDISNGLLTVAGNLAVDRGGSISLGYVRPPPPPPVGDDALPARVYETTSGPAFANLGGSLVSLGYVRPPPPPPIGDGTIPLAQNFLSVTGEITIGDYAILNIGLDPGYTAQYGDAFVLMESSVLGGIHIGNNVSTNLGAGWMLIDPLDSLGHEGLLAVYAPVPEPSTVLLLGGGLAGLALAGIRRRIKARKN